MQVACSQCGAKYEFEASAIPAAGYDAQCTSCGNVFFVAPEAPPAPPLDQQVSIACSTCGAVYQFAASAIPPSGYDAQCTQCHSVFFVSPAPASSPPATVQLPDYAAPEVPALAMEAPFAAPASAPEPPSSSMTPPPSPVEPVELAEAELAEAELDVAGAALEEPVPLDEMSESPGCSPPAASAPSPATPGGGFPKAGPASMSCSGLPASGMPGAGQSEAADLVAIGASLGDPEAAAADAETDFESIMRKRRWRVRFGLGTLAVMVLAVAGLYFLAPRAFDLSIGRIVGSKRTVDPAAVPLAEQGKRRLLDDTKERLGSLEPPPPAPIEKVESAVPEKPGLAAKALKAKRKGKKRR